MSDISQLLRARSPDKLLHEAAELAEVKRPLDEQMARLNANLTAANARIAELESEHEVRGDGARVRKDRWETGVRRIVALIWGNRFEFEIDEVVERVRIAVTDPHNDDEALVKSVLDR